MNKGTKNKSEAFSSLFTYKLVFWGCYPLFKKKKSLFCTELAGVDLFKNMHSNLTL